jgi:hypothetical protein
VEFDIEEIDPELLLHLDTDKKTTDPSGSAPMLI